MFARTSAPHLELSPPFWASAKAIVYVVTAIEIFSLAPVGLTRFDFMRDTCAGAEILRSNM